MKVICPKSGLSYYANVGYGIAISPHPIFSLPLSKLIAQLEDWASGKLTGTDEYLLGLAFLAKAPTHWTSPTKQEQAGPIITTNLESLSKVVLRLHTLSLEDVPSFVINKNTAGLEQLPNWINVLNEALAAQVATVRAGRIAGRIARQEESITKLINRGLDRSGSKLAGLVASWAAIAGDFPTFKTVVQGKEVTCSVYWQSIIQIAWTGNYIAALQNGVTPSDVKELIEHCEDQIPHGSTHSYLLMKTLRGLYDLISEFRPVSPIVVNEPDADITDGADSKETITSTNANNSTTITTVTSTETLAAAIPLPEPARNQFKSQMDYLRARIKWQQSVLSIRAYRAANATSTGVDENEL